jgi:hypothetical protein
MQTTKTTSFEIQANQFLEALATGLALATPWKKTSQDSQFRYYRNGAFNLEVWLALDKVSHCVKSIVFAYRLDDLSITDENRKETFEILEALLVEAVKATSAIVDPKFSMSGADEITTTLFQSSAAKTVVRHGMEYLMNEDENRSRVVKIEMFEER